MTAIVREFVSLESPSARRAGAGGRPCQGLYHRAEGTSPKVAVIATHYEVDFAEHYLAEYLAVRGIGMLGWNTRYRGAGMYFSLGPALADIGRGVRWLRDQAAVETVVILGNSGGASLMSAYHAEAVDPILGGAEGLAPGDLFISLNAHAGRPDVLTAWLDPSVTDEGDPLSVDPALDMFRAEHGPPYAPDFVARYRAAQVARNERITEWCRAELVRLSAGGGSERVFQVPRTWADLRFLDLTIEPSERAIGCYAGDARTANYGPFGLAAANTCRSWLAMWSLSDSRCRAEPHLAKVTVPALVVQSTGDQGCYRSDGVGIHAALGSDDKTFAELAGDHYFLSPPDGRSAVADLIISWLEPRS
ncbi:MAG: alpha/beta hydrolase [Acidimicrobiales bacterium]